MTTGNSLARYVLRGHAATWLAREYGSACLQPNSVTPTEASGIINDAIGNGLIHRGPAEISASCITDDQGGPDGWKIFIGPRHLDYWLASRMLRATSNAAEAPLTYPQVLQEAVDVANGILADCEDRGLTALFGED